MQHYYAKDSFDKEAYVKHLLAFTEDGLNYSSFKPLVDMGDLILSLLWSIINDLSVATPMS